MLFDQTYFCWTERVRQNAPVNQLSILEVVKLLSVVRKVLSARPVVVGIGVTSAVPPRRRRCSSVTDGDGRRHRATSVHRLSVYSTIIQPSSMINKHGIDVSNLTVLFIVPAEMSSSDSS